jgi:hypothetical protein
VSFRCELLNGLLCDVQCTWCDYLLTEWPSGQPIIRSLVIDKSTLHIAQQAI